jgi:RimJ/RimL family protein N-acetyltransferase
MFYQHGGYMPDIYFEKNPETNRLNVSIKTERLIIKSTISSHLSDYKKLLMNPENMLKVMHGIPWSEDRIEEQHKQWVINWNNGNPFSSLAIFKKDTDKFIGHVFLLADSERPGIVELGYVFDNTFWGKGYGTEAILIIVQKYAPELVKHDYKPLGEKIKRIEATAHPENQPSIKLLQKAGMKKIGEKPKYGQPRYFFSINVDLIKFPSAPVGAIHPRLM